MLSPEDKAIISEYMGWCNHKYAKSGKLWGTGICIKCKDPLPLNHHFDSNHASLCVEKMIKEVDWESFFYHALGYTWNNMPGDEENSGMSFFIAWLFNPDNFFQAMAAWLRQK